MLWRCGPGKSYSSWHFSFSTLSCEAPHPAHATAGRAVRGPCRQVCMHARLCQKLQAGTQVRGGTAHNGWRAHPPESGAPLTDAMHGVACEHGRASRSLRGVARPPPQCLTWKIISTSGMLSRFHGWRHLHVGMEGRAPQAFGVAFDRDRHVGCVQPLPAWCKRSRKGVYAAVPIPRLNSLIQTPVRACTHTGP